MSGNEINSRDFLKIMGWGGAGVAIAGCDMPSTRTLEEGQEEVTAYLLPEEYVIPGIAVFYASTCQQCPAGCATHNRVREGRVLKVEGNPESSLTFGKVCQMGQAGLQQHYIPAREGRVLMVVCYPESSLYYCIVCLMGQAGLQQHYKPDQHTKPLIRKG